MGENLLDKIIRDEEGKIVVAQTPNLPILMWFVFFCLEKITLSESLKNFTGFVSFGFLFTWSYLEVFDGANLFRRFLGLIVIIVALFIY